MPNTIASVPSPRGEKQGPHFVCPSCGQQDWKVLDTRFYVEDRGKPDRVYRRRACRSCGYRLSTHEVVAKA